ncbi:hypothetical protein FRC11_012372 [Ceratobasidium sp. 423]|nr:hypothetical protein FRC11_012372 [Ceratobasidium sp. 423]
MFATSLSSKSRGKSDQAPKSSFAERFGSPTQPQGQGSQTSFPTWPGLQSTQASSYANPLSFHPPPQNPIAPGKDSTSESKQTTSASTTRRYRQPTGHTQSVRKQRELFSDRIGNASSFVNTSSFEAKVAMEPAAHTLSRWMVAAKTCSLLPASQASYQTKVVDIKRTPSRPPFWELCAIWVLAAASEIRLRPQPVMSGFMRRFCAFHPSVLVFSRGYATQRKRGFKRQAYTKRDTTRAHRGKQKPASVRKQRRKEQPNPQHSPKKSHFIHENPPDIDGPCILIPAPTTQAELCNALRYLIQSTEPPIPLPRLIATHIQYSTLQTSESYNLLLAHASRVAPIPYSAQIISQLRASGVIWTKRTEQLVVRAHIQCGQWEEAANLAEKLWVDGLTSRVPLNIFAELLHVVLTKKATMEDIASMADRCWKLFPTGATVDVIDRSPRIAYNIVRLLVNAERHKHALQLATKLLESLKAPTPSNIRHCRSILCHIIRPPRGRPSAYPFEERRRLFESLLHHNPSLGLTPDSGLTCALLQNLRKRRKRGPIAFHTLLELRAKYGPQVEDAAVRRTIARYAIDEENLDLARNMFEREGLARLEDSKQAQSSQPESEAPWVGQNALPTQSHLEYLRNKGPENRKFTVTARSLRRKELKLGRRERVHPENILAAQKRARRWRSIHPGRKQHLIRRAVQFTSGGSNEDT